jgi:hypothetical protein
MNVNVWNALLPEFQNALHKIMIEILIWLVCMYALRRQENGQREPQTLGMK